jgi:hypothetical protein
VCRALLLLVGHPVLQQERLENVLLDEFQRARDGEPIPGQKPSRGAVEVKSTRDDAWVTAESDQENRRFTWRK